MTFERVPGRDVSCLVPWTVRVVDATDRILHEGLRVLTDLRLHSNFCAPTETPHRKREREPTAYSLHALLCDATRGLPHVAPCAQTIAFPHAVFRALTDKLRQGSHCAATVEDLHVMRRVVTSLRPNANHCVLTLVDLHVC